MKERWTEADVLALPQGEHDYFDRKAGAVYSAQGRSGLRGTLAVAASAFPNTGGGSLVLGIEDDGVTFDGLPATRGATPTREWIEQMLPPLVAYPLAEFRVHEVEPDPAGTAIPSGRVVIVVDFGDSPAAPHQCDYGGEGAIKGVYYMRRGGHSVPAPHHYIELVRQRLTAPVLVAELEGIRVRKAAVTENTGAIFAHMQIRLRVRNQGQVAAYKWLVIADIAGDHPDFNELLEKDEAEFPIRDSASYVQLDHTILPGVFDHEEIEFGLWLRPARPYADLIGELIEAVLGSAVLRYRISTEVGQTEDRTIQLADKLDSWAMGNAIELQL